MKKLVIVESPNKVKKIKSFLNGDSNKKNNDFEVLSSVGHIRELAKSGKFALGIDLDSMTPKYVVSKDKKEVIKEINLAAKKSDIIYLATDPDREGESIAWHIKEIIDLENNKISKKNPENKKEYQFQRIVFNEITKEAIENSIEHASTLNQNLINSQEARRMLDRMIGFRLSFLTKKKISAKSSGRVKSSVLKLIIDRENEIEAFAKETWFTLELELSKNIIFKYVESNKNFQEIKANSKEELEKIIPKLNLKEINFVKTLKSLKSAKPPEPLEMATLLMKAYSSLGYSNQLTTLLSQALYEKGFITYPRTDSKRISSESFLDDAKSFINKETKSSFNIYKYKNSNSQDAHEAVRPVGLEVELLNSSELKPREKKLYLLIWTITLQSFMEESITETTKYIYETNNYYFSFSNSKIIKQGFKELKLDDDKIDLINEFKSPSNFSIIDNNVKVVEHETKPPGRYNQSSLIKKMKEEGIGRPSTYSSTSSGLIKYNYITSEKGTLIPTSMGKEVNDLLLKNFGDIIDEKYTSFLESELDRISVGEINIKDFLSKFWNDFSQRVEIANETIEQKMPEFVDRKCPDCDGELVYKMSRYGSRFIACLNFPTCKYAESIEKKEIDYVNEKCPECGGELVYRNTKRNNKRFIGCGTFPKCRYLRDIPKEKGIEKATEITTEKEN